MRRGSLYPTVIAAAIVWAADHGARVINLSLGGPGSSVALADAIAYASARDVIVVAAVGNAGATTQFFPAADTHAVSVAATTVADRRYSWSNFGSWVRVAAPGCNLAPVRGGGYGTFCGTSSATPVVAGLVALELSAQPSATISAGFVTTLAGRDGSLLVRLDSPGLPRPSMLANSSRAFFAFLNFALA